MQEKTDAKTTKANRVSKKTKKVTVEILRSMTLEDHMTRIIRTAEIYDAIRDLHRGNCDSLHITIKIEDDATKPTFQSKRRYRRIS
jgi:hypothetical protein